MIEFLAENKDNLAEIIGLIIALLMAVFRVFPTENGEGLLLKIDKWFNRILDFLKIPNPSKKKDE